MSIDSFSRAVFPRLDRADVQEAREQARVRGHAEGHAAGFRAAAEEAAIARADAEAARLADEAETARVAGLALASLHAAARSFADRERDLTAATEHQVLGRATELAELILQAELTDAAASATAAVRRALSAASAETVRELRMHPDDLKTLEGLDALPRGFRLVPDDALDRGDTMVTLEQGVIDARIGTALARARRALAEGVA